MFKIACFTLFTAVVLSAQPSVVTTGLVGISEGQTAQVNVLNPGVQPPALGVLCSAGVVLLDDDGNVLKAATLTIPPGQSKTIQVKGDTDLGLAVQGDRKEIRAVIASPSFAPAANGAACRLAPTLEIFDSMTGRTQVVLSQVTAVPGVVASPQAAR